MNQELISEQIKLIVAKKGTSLPWLAKEVGMTKTGFYKMLESHSYKVETLYKIAEALEVTLYNLLPPMDSEGERPISPKEGEFFLKIIYFSMELGKLYDYLWDSKNNSSRTRDEILNDVKDMVTSLREISNKLPLMIFEAQPKANL